MELELYTKEDMNNYASWYIKKTGQYPDDDQALKEGLYLKDFNKIHASNIEDVIKLINLEQLALEAYPIDNQETSKGCIDDMNLSDRQTWISGAKKILSLFKKPLSQQALGRMNRNSQSTPVTITVTVEEPKQKIVILNPYSENILVQTVDVIGMPLVRWSYKGCEVDFGVGEDFATIYSVESKDQGKGYATKLLGIAKAYYEQCGKKFGGTVALNDTMAHIYKKLNIEEYDN